MLDMANRRSVLIGLGGLVAGGGALIGTGAFDTVEAERTVSVETSGDASALLGLAPADGNYGTGVVQTDTGDDTGLIQINIDGNSNGGGNGLNQDAITSFNNLVTVTNQGTQDVESLELGFPNESDVGIDFSATFSFLVSDSSDESDFSSSGDTVSPSSDGGVADILTSNNDVPDTLTPGDTVTFGLEINLIDGGNPDGDLPQADYTMDVVAETTDN